MITFTDPAFQVWVQNFQGYLFSTIITKAVVVIQCAQIVETVSMIGSGEPECFRTESRMKFPLNVFTSIVVRKKKYIIQTFENKLTELIQIKLLSFNPDFQEAVK